MGGIGEVGGLLFVFVWIVCESVFLWILHKKPFFLSAVVGIFVCSIKSNKSVGDFCRINYKNTLFDDRFINLITGFEYIKFIGCLFTFVNNRGICN